MQKRNFKILSMDGGPSLVVYCRLLREAVRHIRDSYPEGKYPGFFDQIDLISGSSAGALLGLKLNVLRNKYPNLEDEDTIFAELVDFADDVLRYCNVSLDGAIRTIFSQGTCVTTEEVQEFLQDSYGDTTMKELSIPLMVLSYQVDRYGSKQDVGGISRPNMFFSHFDAAHEAEAQAQSLTAADLGARTSACSIWFPIYQSNLDGGFSTNNPSMAAVSRLVALGRKSENPKIKGITTEDMTVLTMGMEVPDLGMQFGEIQQPSDPWGWIQWIGPNWGQWIRSIAASPTNIPSVLNEITSAARQEPHTFCLFLSAIFNGFGQGINSILTQLLPPGQVLRLAVPTEKNLGPALLLMFTGQAEDLIDDAQTTYDKWVKEGNPLDYTPSLEQTKEWLLSRWFDGVEVA